VARHQRLKLEAALQQIGLGQHHDQVLDLLRIGDFVAARGVVNGPTTRAHPSLTTMLLDGGTALPRRHDLEVTIFGRARQLAAAHHPVPVGLQLGQHHLAGPA